MQERRGGSSFIDDFCASLEGSPGEWSDVSSISSHTPEFDLDSESTLTSETCDLREDSDFEDSEANLISKNSYRFENAPFALQEFCLRLVRRAVIDPSLVASFPEIYALVISLKIGAVPVDDQPLFAYNTATKLYSHLSSAITSKPSFSIKHHPVIEVPPPPNVAIDVWYSHKLDDSQLRRVMKSSVATIDNIRLSRQSMLTLYGNAWDEDKNDSSTILQSHELATNPWAKNSEPEEYESQNEDAQHKGPPSATSSSQDVQGHNVKTSSKNRRLSYLNMLNLFIFLISILLGMLVACGWLKHLPSAYMFFTTRPVCIMTDYWDNLYLWLKFGIDAGKGARTLLVAFRA